MMLKTILYTLLLSLILYGCTHTKDQFRDYTVNTAKQDSIITVYATNCAHNYNYNTHMNEWQNCLDEGLKQDSTIAYLWQQKAMPYFKARKYEVGMAYLDQAVLYNPKRYQPYRAFIKCIFLKTYQDAIVDFTDCKEKWGDNFEMDHTYSFYIGLSQLQLNQFDKAVSSFNEAINVQSKFFKDTHHIDLFYLGITKMEQLKYDEAIVLFDQALVPYPEFSEAMYYKALCLRKQGQPRESYITLYEESIKWRKKGYSINEANAIYELYPYQLQ